MSDIIDVHKRACPNAETTSIIASLDGVSEAKSNTVSLDVYSLKFPKCRHIYPHRIVRPLKKKYIDNKEQLRKVVSDIEENSVKLDALVGDNPVRSRVKCCLNHSALFPCEYCFAKETKFMVKKTKHESKDNHKTHIIQKIKNIRENVKTPGTLKVLSKLINELEENHDTKGRQMVVWPSSTANQEPATKESILNIIEMINEHENDLDSDPLTRDELKGVVERSLLLDLEYFDFINGVPAEYMHLSCLGVVKRLTELTFNVGTNRPRITKRKLSSTQLFNTLMSLTKNPFEFSRRSRDLDFSVYKAEEFRNLVLFFFPHVLECLENDAKERELWLYLAFMIRACILPDVEYFNVNVNQILMACTKFYKLYEKLFGVSNCTYSIHVLCCHLLQIRELGPFTETSAFSFESFYGEIRNSFTPGTPSTLKQVFEKIMLKRALGPHSCEKSIQISNYDTALRCDSLVYTYENDTYKMFKVLDIVNEEVICHPQGKFTCKFNSIPELCWSSVGVFKKGPTSKEIVKIRQKSIEGKVLKVGLFLITCPENVLREK